MNPTTTVKIGSITLAGLEIPEVISGGGSQVLTVQRLVGGVKVIDAMGRDDHDISWQGLFYGNGAVERCRAFDFMRISGQQQPLVFGGFNYTVVVKEFTYDQHYQYQIPYKITCEVVADNNTPITSNATPPIDSAVQSDLSTSQSLASSVNDPTTTALMASLATAIAAVPTFAFATPGTVSSVLQPLSAVQTQVSNLISANDDTMGSVGGFGGAVAGGQPSAIAAALIAQASANSASNSLLTLRGLLGRMSANLTAINGSPNTVAVAGGNLFQIAVEQYDDATAWTGIATANGLTDPFIQGTEVLNIPLQPAQSDGILNS